MYSPSSRMVLSDGTGKGDSLSVLMGESLPQSHYVIFKLISFKKFMSPVFSHRPKHLCYHFPLLMILHFSQPFPSLVLLCISLPKLYLLIFIFTLAWHFVFCWPPLWTDCYLAPFSCSPMRISTLLKVVGTLLLTMWTSLLLHRPPWPLTFKFFLHFW